ncbi:MAG: hypothetical protein N2318_07775 [Meiothermus sp.]|nr:hypothetical protein [Meiothermus sp.]
MIRTQVVRALGGFHNYLGGTDDVDLWTRISDQHTVLTLTTSLYLYRIHNKSTSTQRFFRDKLDTLAVETNTLRRRAGQPEYRLEEFEQVLNTLPLWIRVNHWRVWWSLYLYRVAGGYLANRQIKGMGYLFGSMLLAPEQIFTRLYKQLAPWFAPKVKYASVSLAASWAWLAESFERFLERW